METKHTKEYAEKLSSGLIPINNREAYIEGYMDAVRQTAATDLLEACKVAFNLCDKLQMPTESELNILKIDLINAIKKATE